MSATDREALFYAMLRVRRVEEALAERYTEWEMRCPMHLSIGQEAVAVGVCSALRREDVVFSNHRGHAHYLAKGGDLPRFVAEFYGKATGCSGGRGGSMHLIDLEAGFGGSTPIVGGTVALAPGAALAFQTRGEARVAVAFFGDGCFEEGIIHESLNFAALHRLPVLFVCENNGYSVYTGLSERQPDRPIAAIAAAHGWHVARGDGNDVEEVFRLARAAVDRARGGFGPQFIEVDTHRWREHCGPFYDDDLGYRRPGELAAWQARCPVEALALRMQREGALTASRREEMERAIRKEIAAAFEFARASPAPGIESLVEHVYG